jgi:hypothetical protein
VGTRTFNECALQSVITLIATTAVTTTSPLPTVMTVVTVNDGGENEWPGVVRHGQVCWAVLDVDRQQRKQCCEKVHWQSM